MRKFAHVEEMAIWDREDFIKFLKETLIPDLKDSGNYATAEDFETAIFFMDTIPIEDYAFGTTGHTDCVVQRQRRVFRRCED